MQALGASGSGSVSKTAPPPAAASVYSHGIPTPLLKIGSSAHLRKFLVSAARNYLEDLIVCNCFIHRSEPSRLLKIVLVKKANRYQVAGEDASNSQFQKQMTKLFKAASKNKDGLKIDGEKIIEEAKELAKQSIEHPATSHVQNFGEDEDEIGFTSEPFDSEEEYADDMEIAPYGFRGRENLKKEVELFEKVLKEFLREV
jgi:hypothetical protein